MRLSAEIHNDGKTPVTVKLTVQDIGGPIGFVGMDNLRNWLRTIQNQMNDCHRDRKRKPITIPDFITGDHQ